MTQKRDLEKIKQFARDSGVKLRYSDHKDPVATAVCYPESGQITLYNKCIYNTKSHAATLLHEICHFLAYNKNNRAFDKYHANPQTQKQHKDIYLIEKRDVSKMVDLFREIGCKYIPENYIAAMMEYDIWVYKYIWMFGIEPTRERKREERRKLTRQYGMTHIIK